MLVLGAILVGAAITLAAGAYSLRPGPTTSRAVARRAGLGLLAAGVILLAPLLVPGSSSAANGPTVPLATAAEYSVLAGSTVTNSGPSVLAGSLGLSPGTDVTGFPPGTVVPPGVQNVTNAAAAQAQLDLGTAYVDAAGRPIDATTTADLGGLELQAGVYAGPSHGALGLTGPLVLDGAGDPTSVFIFQTDSSLTTATGSTVTLQNGAQACNVFWQVDSSATLGTDSVFVGNILALTSISVNTDASVEGRALARNGAVTLLDNTFTEPSCATTPGSTTSTTGPTTSTTGSTTSTTASPPGSTSTTVAASTTSTTLAAGGSTGGPGTTPSTGGDTPGDGAGGPGTDTDLETGTETGDGTGTETGDGTGTETGDGTGTGTDTGTESGDGTGTTLAETGSPTTAPLLLAVAFLTLGAIALCLGRERTAEPIQIPTTGS